MARFRHALAVVLAGLIAVTAAARPAPVAQDEDLDAFILAIQASLQNADPGAYRALLLARDEATAQKFAEEIHVRGVTRVTVRERDRQHLTGALPGEGYRLLLEVFTEIGARGRIVAWRVDVRLARLGSSESPARAWRIVDQERGSTLDGLYRLALDPTKQYAVREFEMDSVDFHLKVASGEAFAAETDEGITALVVRGRGQMRFMPPDEAERTQLRLFSGSESIVAPFDEVYIRVSPEHLPQLVKVDSLRPSPVDPRAFKRAQEVFARHVRQSYSLNLSDLSADTWSLAPSGEDCIVEVHTGKLGSLTYARAMSEAEDISLFDRARRRNISVYASAAKLKARGRFYNEDDLSDYDVLDYYVNATFTPLREWIEGEATLHLRVTEPALTTVTLRLDEDLVVRSVSMPGVGRLMHLRVVGQNTLIVSLPTVVPRNAELEISVAYGGHLASQPLDREAATVEQDPQAQQAQPSDVVIPLEPVVVYSNRAHWYPRSPVSDYATATLRLTVPAEYNVIATGLHAVGSPMPGPVRQPGGTAQRVFLFIAGQPVRYLACLITRLVSVDRSQVELATDAAADDPAIGERGVASLDFDIEAHPRQQAKGRSLRDSASKILQFYASIMGEAPYPSFSLALVDGLVPGGHSPAYFALLQQPLPTTPLRWQNDPVSFGSFSAFYLAHEIAHQWWGQAVGWQNYHEQWLSEGIAQYFAALYAEQEVGPEVFANLLRQMRRWSMRYSDQGPVYLGYRVGHVKGDSRIFRAVVYNKAALVLHMLRRLIGDEKFFAGLRQFYREHRFRKAGTEDLRRAMESQSRRSLERFFEQWIYGSRVPTLRFSWEVDESPSTGGPSVSVRFEQVAETFDVPVTVTLVYVSGTRRSFIVPVTDTVIVRKLPLEDRLRTVEVNADNAALAEFTR